MFKLRIIIQYVAYLTSSHFMCMLSRFASLRTSKVAFNRVLFKNANLPAFLRTFSSVPVAFERSDKFLHRHTIVNKDTIQMMLKTCGVSNMDELIDGVIPKDIRRAPVAIHTGEQSESEWIEKLAKIADKNIIAKNFIGQGYSGTIVPNVIKRNVLENPGWYTAYTPYQAEISQGRLESLLIYQTMVSELTGMEVANASLLDEGTAAAEAMNMVHKMFPEKKNRNLFLVSEHLHPQTFQVMRTRAEFLGITLKRFSGKATDAAVQDPTVCGAIVGYPDTRGVVEDLSPLSKALKANEGAQLIVTSDLLALTLLTPPGQMGADIVVGNSQRFGVPMGNGGPHAAFFATSAANIRKMPGRIIGQSIDARGEPALRMALQTREQHIRKDKATSNICTAQALLANMATFYAIYHGPEGLTRIARRVHGFAAYAADCLANQGWNLADGKNIFDTVTVSGKDAEAVFKKAEERNINLRRLKDGSLSIAFDETHTFDDVKEVLSVFGVSSFPSLSDSPSLAVSSKSLHRAENSFMKQDIFHKIRSETEMMRYLKYLENKDLALNRAMIPLGSCTMKLNSASSMYPVSWEKFGNIHPFAPDHQKKGYEELISSLETSLAEITSFDAVSLQPNSGANGEYAGLLAIRNYQKSVGEGHRNVVVIPASAHGTNPASAVMAGLIIKSVPSDANGNIDMVKFEKICRENAANLSCVMVTYPSTHGVFEAPIRRLCDIVHECGGQVYMDGANMNAQVAITSPGFIGADVCHLNLHKSFGIAHGGGGPGVGPIGVRSHLAPFLPRSGNVKCDFKHVGATGPVSSAEFGSALVLSIPWMYINMLGADGLKSATEMAILNANYMMSRLRGTYTIKYLKKDETDPSRSFCAHEFIIDCSQFKSTGVTEEDIAKRLMDYGFHAPTMSWPVPHSLMIEPTESEPLFELDRFVDALLSIRGEIAKIESGVWPKDNNPLKNSPHTVADVMDGKWNRPYTVKEAVYPTAKDNSHTSLSSSKYWPSVNRLDNPHGDKNLMCTCGDVSDYATGN